MTFRFCKVVVLIIMYTVINIHLPRNLKNLTYTHLTSPHLTSPHLTSPHLTSPHLTSPHLTSPQDVRIQVFPGTVSVR